MLKARALPDLSLYTLRKMDEQGLVGSSPYLSVDSFASSPYFLDSFFRKSASSYLRTLCWGSRNTSSFDSGLKQRGALRSPSTSERGGIPFVEIARRADAYFL